MLVHGYQVVQPLETLRSPLSITRSEPLRPGAEAWRRLVSPLTSRLKRVSGAGVWVKNPTLRQRISVNVGPLSLDRGVDLRGGRRLGRRLPV